MAIFAGSNSDFHHFSNYFKKKAVLYKIAGFVIIPSSGIGSYKAKTPLKGGVLHIKGYISVTLHPGRA
jgi:hypothetical protein